MITLNIFGYDKQKIKQIAQQFKKQRVGSILVTVISNKKTIYTCKIHQQKLISLQLCSKLINAKKKIIDLDTHQINTVQQPDSQYYITQLFNSFFLFLISGYIQVRQNMRMDLIYLFVHSQIQQDRFSLLLKKIQNKYYNKLWEVILLVFNHAQGKKYRSTITKLIETNPYFLIDLDDQRQINKNFLRLKSIQIVKQFLKFLYLQLNKKVQNRNEKHIRLIDILLKQYIYKNSLNKQLYAKYINQIIQLINPQSQNQILIKQIEKKEKQIEQIKNKQKIKANQLNQQIQKYQTKIKKLKNQIEELQNKDPKEDLIKQCKSVHHPDLPDCTQKFGILLPCGHYNCIACSANRIYSISEKLFTGKNKTKIEQYKIKCLDIKNNCKQIFTSEIFELILNNYHKQ